MDERRPLGPTDLRGQSAPPSSFPSATGRSDGSNLGHAAIDKEFDPIDEAALVGSEEEESPRNFIGDADASDRSRVIGASSGKSCGVLRLRFERMSARGSASRVQS